MHGTAVVLVKFARKTQFFAILAHMIVSSFLFLFGSISQPLNLFSLASVVVHCGFPPLTGHMPHILALLEMFLLHHVVTGLPLRDTRCEPRRIYEHAKASASMDRLAH